MAFENLTDDQCRFVQLPKKLINPQARSKEKEGHEQVNYEVVALGGSNHVSELYKNQNLREGMEDDFSYVISWMGCLLFATFCLFGCDNKPKQENSRKTIDYIKKIPGIDDSIPAKVAEKGEVLIAYSDCYICHKEDERSVGPAFKDIAQRYPVNKVYIEMLAQKVIAGGSGSWGSSVMDPHPKLSFEDAKMMVTYILSMKK